MPNPNGQLILISEAEAISKSYDSIKNASNTKINLALPVGTKESEYYSKEVKAFLFDLELIEDYINKARNKDQQTAFLLVIKAAATSADATPTTIIAAAKQINSSGKGTFEIIPIKDVNDPGAIEEKVPEHPGIPGTISFGTPKPGQQTLFFTIQ